RAKSVKRTLKVISQAGRACVRRVLSSSESVISFESIVRSLSQHRLFQRVATDEHLDTIASVLDDIFRIPGTHIRFGLDAIIGWIPGIGDAAAGIASFLIIFAAWRRGTPGVTLTRMVANVVL